MKISPAVLVGKQDVVAACRWRSSAEFAGESDSEFLEENMQMRRNDLKSNDRQPIYLFADSRAMFCEQGGSLFIERIRHSIGRLAPKAGYIGAANDDSPEFYAIFEAAMNAIGIHDCKMLHASLPECDRIFLQQADVVLLSGDDIEKAGSMLEKTGAKDLLISKYDEGITLIGVSAGAVQLGTYGILEKEKSSASLIETLKLVPFVVDVHDELNHWEQLGRVILLLGGAERGIGIPSGGGLVYHSDHSIEVVSRVLYEFSCVKDKLIVETCWAGARAEHGEGAGERDL